MVEPSEDSRRKWTLYSCMWKMAAEKGMWMHSELPSEGRPKTRRWKWSRAVLLNGGTFNKQFFYAASGDLFALPIIYEIFMVHTIWSIRCINGSDQVKVAGSWRGHKWAEGQSHISKYQRTDQRNKMYLRIQCNNKRFALFIFIPCSRQKKMIFKLTRSKDPQKWMEKLHWRQISSLQKSSGSFLAWQAQLPHKALLGFFILTLPHSVA